MIDDKKNIIYTAKDIEQYLSGSLSSAQMHAMEKAALDDPFLAEAMEGYEEMKDRDWKAPLTALHEEFISGKPGAKVIALRQSTGRWWKAAAAVFVIGCGAALTWWLTKDKTNDQGQASIAQIIAPAKDSPKPGLTTITPKTKNPELATTTTKQNIDQDTRAPKQTLNPVTGRVTEKNDIGSGNLSQANVKTDRSFLYKPGRQAKPDLAKTEKANPVEEKEKYKPTSPAVTMTPPISANNAANGNDINAKNTETVQSNEGLLKKKAQQNAVSNKQVTLNRNFSAQVVGPDNAPLPYANINIKNENFGTYADVKGNFRLVSTDSLLNIEVRSVGYQPRMYTLRSNAASNKIVLSEDNTSLQERTVAKDKNAMAERKTLSRRATLIKDSVVNVEPKDGWDNYSTYVANNIDIPDGLIKTEEHGEVQISFDVRSNGTITNVRVDQSGCDHCALEAKRLIEQGPQWKVKKGKKASARIKLQF